MEKTTECATAEQHINASYLAYKEVFTHGCITLHPSHLTHKTYEMLQSLTEHENGAAFYGVRAYTDLDFPTWLQITINKMDEMNEEIIDGNHSYPKDLLDVLQLALACNCLFITFDKDAMKVNCLPVYEWGN